MSYFQTNLSATKNPPFRTYYRVTAPFTVHECTGHTPSGYYYGSSQIHVPVYVPLTVAVGGYILDLPGGIFYAAERGAVCRPVVLKPDDKSPFEKRYFPDRHDWPLDKLERCDEIPYVPQPNA